MMRANLINRPTQIFIAGNALLALVLVFELSFASRPADPMTPPLDGINAELPEFGNVSLAPPSMAQLIDMLDRPLFYNNRRMPVPPKTVAPPPPPTPLLLKLEGVAIAAGSRVAVLRILNGNRLLQMVEGEAHEGWTLDSLSSTSANFSRGGQSTKLLLDPGTNGVRR